MLPFAKRCAMPQTSKGPQSELCLQGTLRVSTISQSISLSRSLSEAHFEFARTGAKVRLHLAPQSIWHAGIVAGGSAAQALAQFEVQTESQLAAPLFMAVLH